MVKRIAEVPTDQFWCICDCGMIRVELWKEDDTGLGGPEIWVSMFKRAHHYWPMPFSTRIKAALSALLGDLWRDEVILPIHEAERMRDRLTDLLAQCEREG